MENMICVLSTPPQIIGSIPYLCPRSRKANTKVLLLSSSSAKHYICWKIYKMYIIVNLSERFWSCVWKLSVKDNPRENRWKKQSVFLLPETFFQGIRFIASRLIKISILPMWHIVMDSTIWYWSIVASVFSVASE